MDSFYFFATEKESSEGWLEGEGGWRRDQEANTNFLGKKIVSDQFILPCNIWCGKNTVGQKVKSK